MKLSFFSKPSFPRCTQRSVNVRKKQTKRLLYGVRQKSMFYSDCNECERIGTKSRKRAREKINNVFWGCWFCPSALKARTMELKAGWMWTRRHSSVERFTPLANNRDGIWTFNATRRVWEHGWGWLVVTFCALCELNTCPTSIYRGLSFGAMINSRCRIR